MNKSDRKMVKYRHINDKSNMNWFNQYADDPIPEWATDVQDYQMLDKGKTYSEIVVMDWEQIYNSIKSGEVTYDEFETWLEDRRADWIADGVDSCTGWTDFS